MATAKQPKSILKKSYPATSATSSKTKEERDLELALYHANLIQQRKDTELKILLSMEELIEYPLANTPYDASNPSPADAKSFKDHIRPFQPSDYDALIVERNINGHCGYTLCRNDHVKVGGGKVRIIWAKDFKVVERAELERWCSPECGKRALYVKVQLNETAAWERNAWDEGVDIDLLDEPKDPETSIVEGMNNMDVDDNTTTKKDAADLALERGDQPSAARNALVTFTIHEKEVSKPAQAPSLHEPQANPDELERKMDQLNLALGVEGYTSKFGTKGKKKREGVDGEQYDDSDEDTDFKI